MPRLAPEAGRAGMSQTRAARSRTLRGRGKRYKSRKGEESQGTKQLRNERRPN